MSDELIEYKDRLASYAEIYGQWLFELTPEQARAEAHRCRDATIGKEAYPESLSFAMQSMQFEDIACLIDNIKREELNDYFKED